MIKGDDKKFNKKTVPLIIIIITLTDLTYIPKVRTLAKCTFSNHCQKTLSLKLGQSIHTKLIYIIIVTLWTHVFQPTKQMVIA